MSEEVGTPAAASADAGTQSAAPAAMQAPAATSGEQPWYTSLPQEIATNPNITKFTSVEELAKGHINMSTLLGRDKIPMPKTDQEFIDVMRRLGSPTEAGEFKLGEEVGPAFTLQDAEQFVHSKAPEFKKEFKERMHEFGMTQKQAEKTYDWYIKSLHESHTAQTAQVETEMQMCGDALRSQWGEAMQVNLKIAGQAMQKFFGPEVTAKVDAAGLGRDPKFVQVMYEIGSRASEELGIDKRGFSARTPQELDADISTLMGHPAFLDKSHPEHKAIQAKVTALFQRRHPNTEPA